MSAPDVDGFLLLMMAGTGPGEAAAPGPWLDVTESLLPPGEAVEVTVGGVPGHHYAVAASRARSGLVVGGVPLALGEDAVVVASGRLDAQGRARFDYLPPFGPGGPDRVHLQAVTSAGAGFAALLASPGRVLRDAAVWTRSLAWPAGSPPTAPDSGTVPRGSLALRAAGSGPLLAAELGGQGGEVSCTGCVGAAAIDSTQVQRRVEATCPAGEAVREVNLDGTVTCEPAGLTGTGIVASGGNVGIGVDSPEARLDVAGPVWSEGVLRVAPGAPTTHRFSNRRYVVEAPPAVVGQVVPLDHGLVSGLCRDRDGCLVSIQRVNWDAAQPGNVASREARLFLSQASASTWWRLADIEVGGEDGDDVTVSQEFSVFDCVFTDAETPVGGPPNSRNDAGPGVGLLNIAGGSFSDATTTCRIVIHD